MKRKEDVALASLKREVTQGVSVTLQKSFRDLGEELSPEFLAEGNRRLIILADPLRYPQ